MSTTDYFGITEAADSSAADFAADVNAILVALDQALGIRREDVVPIAADGTSAPGTIEAITGARARALPSAPPDQTHVVYIALTGDVTVSRGGSDTITRFGTSGATSSTVARNTIGVFRYRTGVWYRIDPQQVAAGDVSGTIDALTVATWGGQTKGQVVGGNAPQAHKASHATGGSDALVPADIGALPSGGPYAGRVVRRVVAVTQSATPAINTDTMDVASITGLAQAITSMTANLTGSPVAGQPLIIEFTDNGTARAIAWGSGFEASGLIALPTTTVAGVKLTVGFLWNTATSKFRCLAVA